jgi:hypothetical protein
MGRSHEEPPDQAGSRRPHPGPIFDRVVRSAVESEPEPFLDWLGIAVEGTPTLLPTTFTAETGRPTCSSRSVLIVSCMLNTSTRRSPTSPSACLATGP